MTQPGEQPTGESSQPDSPQNTPQWPSTGPGPEQANVLPEGGSQSPAGPQAPLPPPAYTPVPQTSNSAIIALVLSIVAWVVCPIIPAIIALVFANKADKEIAVSNGWVTGGGLVTAAKIVSWINIGLYAGLLAIGLIVVILAAVGGALS
jgi:hypothetical protein